MGNVAVYAVFFASGISGLIYQVIWVRLFGNVFGNTVHSAAVVTAVFMLGLGAGSYLAGRWADRKFAQRADYPLLFYCIAEVGIGLLGLILACLLPRLTALSASTSGYVTGEHGWYELSLASHLCRYLFGALLLLPSTLLMGATLTLLIRHVIARNVAAAGWRIGLLYGWNTLGAALGCFLSDFSLVPGLGIFHTQLAAAAINLLAAAGGAAVYWFGRRPGTNAERDDRDESVGPAPGGVPGGPRGVVRMTAVALLLSGFAAMGMEIVWFRFLTYILGGYRAVFSLLLTVVLLGIWIGSVAGGYLHRRWGRPVRLYMAAQAAFVLLSLLLLMAYDSEFMLTYRDAVSSSYPAASGAGKLWIEIWTNLRLILLVVGLPAVCMGFTFPVGNAIVQRLEGTVGRRAGALYLWNTTGNVLGSLAAGFLLLPVLGLQITASGFAMVAAFSLVPLHRVASGRAGVKAWFLACLGLAAAGLIAFSLQPGDRIIRKTFELALHGEDVEVLALEEGTNETLLVIEAPDGTRGLHTNGHAMSSNAPGAQRYMRAFSHVPLLLHERPERVLVICFGVGNTLHAASLHPGVSLLETVDLSRDILEHARYFRKSNRGILQDPRVSVFVNDGRHHLLMQEPEHYDLITLEPPPISFAGVSSLYTREFYELARSRLRSGGYVTQWLPGQQVSEEATLALVRAFIEVFPDSVLLNGFGLNMILLGRKEGRIQLDLERVEKRLVASPGVRRDLERIGMGSLTELAGTFAASHETLVAATRLFPAMEDDWPISEYAVRSKFKIARFPGSLMDVRQIGRWCPACFSDKLLSDRLSALPGFLQVMDSVYRSSRFLLPRNLRKPGDRLDLNEDDEAVRKALAESGYLRYLVRDLGDRPGD